MTEKTKKTGSRLARQLLWMIAKSGLISLILFLILFYIAGTVAANYCFYNDIPMTEFDWIRLDRTIFGGSAALACICFCILFPAMLDSTVTYIRTLTQGIAALKTDDPQPPLPVAGDNELSELAEAINTMSAARQQLREMELAMAGEKEQLIRSLSHDIRTPLTSILGYSELLSQDPGMAEKQRETMEMIHKKARQIRDLTDILLDGTHRNLEWFNDGKLLFQQLAMEFQEALEEQFPVEISLSGCAPFSGRFDVQELRRIFDNLASNIQKYADSAQPVGLTIQNRDGQLQIFQRNKIRSGEAPAEGYQIGLNSIRRIAQLYGGQVTVDKTEADFLIFITFREFL